MKNLKTITILLITILSFKSYGQDSLFVKKDTLKPRIFSFTPKFKGIDKVNGLTFGAGLTFLPNKDGGSITKVNGMNIEINPISPFILMFADPSIINLKKKLQLELMG